MENSKISLEELELHVSGQQKMLNFRLLCEFGIPLHVQDPVLWVENVKIMIDYESIMKTG